MKAITNSLTRLIIPALAFALCGFPELVQAQAQQTGQAQPAASSPQSQPSPSQNSSPGQPTPNQQQQGTTYNPSSPPLAPVPSTEEPTAQPPAAPQQPNAPTPQANAPQRQPQQPLGTAAAESVPTAGGAASKPAGSAIAPAKQRQTRSFLLKLGLVAAAGVAVGTVVALSKGSNSKPPGAQ